MSFKEYLTEKKQFSDKQEEIVKKIKSKYKAEVKLGGYDNNTLIVLDDELGQIGWITQKELKDWDKIISKRLKELKKTVSEPKSLPKGYYKESKESAEELLRTNGFKIKSVFGTSFGTEYVMAKKYDEDDIKEILKDFTLKFNDKSVFVID